MKQRAFPVMAVKGALRRTASALDGHDGAFLQHQTQDKVRTKRDISTLAKMGTFLFWFDTSLAANGGSVAHSALF